MIRARVVSSRVVSVFLLVVFVFVILSVGRLRLRARPRVVLALVFFLAFV